MNSGVIRSWGNQAGGQHALIRVKSRFDRFPGTADVSSVLPFGQGRSYGDSCLNIGGGLLLTRSLDRFIHFDGDSGRLTCEAGVLLSEILRLAVPQGWYLPVVPGTQHVTVGGAIANDVHGKNHHVAGTFARHVLAFELLRSSGERLLCSRQSNAEWFNATSGGLGLTGLIVWAQLQLKPIPGPWMDVESLRFGCVDEFFGLSEESDRNCEYTVAWIDCLARGRQLGRGILQRANHTEDGAARLARPSMQLQVPFLPPFSLVNPLSLRAFNSFRFHGCGPRPKRAVRHFSSFFFPLDRIRHWNRLYGPRGFVQYQCVIPESSARTAVPVLLDSISASRVGSFLAVLKRCGNVPSPGLLSFPLPGVTLALDFPAGAKNLTGLFEHLDAVVAQAAGRLYPAKDGRMSTDMFQRGYPRWREFAQFIDPKCSSSFWRRVSGEVT